MNDRRFVFPAGSELAKLAALLRPWFLPANLGTAPLATGGSGNRRTVLTTSDSYASTVNGQKGAVTVSQQKTVALVAGSLTWTFDSPFSANPVITAVPVGAPTGTPAGLYIFSISPAAVTVKSELSTDTRTVHLTAVTQT